MQQHRQGGRFSSYGWLVITLAGSAAFGCGSDRKPAPPAIDLAHFNYGPTCIEYHGVDPGEIGGERLPATSAGPCRANPNDELCAVCRGASAVGLEEIGVESVDYYYYGSSDRPCDQQFADSTRADECVVIRRGMFEPSAEHLSGPSGISAPELHAGTPNAELGMFAYSIWHLELTDGEIELTRCSNFYGDAFAPGVDRIRDPCPDEARCMTCVSHGQDGNPTYESISYRSAANPDRCRKALAAVDPDGCIQANRGVLVITSD